MFFETEGCVTLIDIIKKAFDSRLDDIKPVTLSGGYTNQTFLIEGTNPLVVAKVSDLANMDAENEVKCLNLLQGKVGAPRVHDVKRFKEWRIVVMDYTPGRNGQTFLDEGNWKRANVLYRIMGEVLSSRLHSVSYDESFGIREQNRMIPLHENSFVPVHLVQQSQFVIDQLNQNETTTRTFTHGDFGPHNVLFTEQNELTILDFEWSEWADPMTDISWLCWFTKLHYPNQARSLISSFLEGYGQLPPSFSKESVKMWAIFKVWQVLVRLEKGSEKAKKEWVRRLEWTLTWELNDIL